MNLPARPAPHEDPQLELLRPYITDTVDALQQAGANVRRSWLDPSAPRDATIVLDGRALVWDECVGWRLGGYVSGEQGERTVLDEERLVGGGVLLDPHSLAAHLRAGDPVATSRNVRPRSFTARDGLNEALEAW